MDLNGHRVGFDRGPGRIAEQCSTRAGRVASREGASASIRMRIVHVIAILSPAHGGPPVICGSLAAAQAGLGHDVSIVTYRDAEFESYLAKTFAPMPGFSRVRVVEMGERTRAEAWLARRARGLLRDEVRGADFVHLHSVWESVLVRAGAEARAAGVPYAILLNGMLDVWSLEQGRVKKRIAMALALRRLLEGAAFLHTGNVDEEAALGPLDLKVPRRRLPNGVFLEQLRPLPSRTAFHEKHPELRGRRFVLFLSRLHYKKGLDYLAEAWGVVASRHPGVDLVVAGPDGGERGAFEARIAALGLTDRVHVVGPVYGEEKLAALAGADVFCLPSRQEGFSMAITEAVGCGVPVVITRECHFPEVGEAGAGRVVGLDAAEVARALDEVLSSEALRREMSSRGRALVEGAYTWPAIARRCVSCYEEFRSKGAR